MIIPSIAEADLEGKRVFVRVDYDAPMSESGSVTDFSKLSASLPTIKHLAEKKAKVIIGSHLGSPGGKLNRKYSLEPGGAMLSEMLDARIYFPDNSIGDSVRKVTSEMAPGEVVLLENLDFHRGERECLDRYARELSRCAAVYVNEAFSLSGQRRASLVTALDYFEELYAGFNFLDTLEALGRLSAPEKPFVVIAGGTGGKEKIDLLDSLLDTADTYIICGALGNIFYAALGRGTGKSVLEKDALYSAKKFISSCSARGIRLALPDDVVAVKGDLNNPSSSFIISGDRVPDNASIVDIGPETGAYCARVISTAKTLLWYGTPGVFPETGSGGGTEEIARAVSEAGAYSVVMGRDTAESVRKLGLVGGMDFLADAGRAAALYLRKQELPALSALEKKANEKKVRSRQLENEYAEE